MYQRKYVSIKEIFIGLKSARQLFYIQLVLETLMLELNVNFLAELIFVYYYRYFSRTVSTATLTSFTM